MVAPHPSFEEFLRLDSGSPFAPVYRQLTGDGLTPVSAFRKLARGGPSFLFESVIGGEKVGRFSFLGTEPFLRFEARGHEVKVTDAANPAASRIYQSADPFRELEALVDRYRSVNVSGLPRFTGGAVGYAAYDAVRYTEHLPNVPRDDRGLPDLSFSFFDRMVLFDHIRKTVLVVAQAHLEAGTDPRKAYQAAADRIDELVSRLAAPGPELELRDIDAEGPVSLEPHSNFTRE